VVFDERAEEGGVGRQPVLRSRRDDAARRGQADGQLEPGRCPQAAAQERILAEGLTLGAVAEHQVGAKAPDVPVGVGGHRAQMGQRAGGDEVDGGDVVVGAGRAEPAIGRRVAALEAHAALEQRRERGLDLGADEGAPVGEGDAQGRVVIAVIAVLEQLGPARAQARIGGPALVRDPLAGRRVDDDPAPVAFAASRSDGHGVEQLAEHRLDRIAPDGKDSHRRIFAQRPGVDVVARACLTLARAVA
jgi:hypothetical protein